ncbi:MAG: ABC transporter ATP-binding protein [Oculatellaceae cyanobacterium Prado106]|jgi:NitT/TauT family transport system ATP-binding protein|nr:ABC transporter ATP-binding protein [Oculatellaceae cyanobacterium Prado106]
MVNSLCPNPSSALSTTPILEFKEISLTYDLKGHCTTVLDRVSLAVERSQFVALVGPSGCGKTSLLRMVSGLLPIQQGTVSFDGEPITKPLRNVGIAFQNPVLLPWRNTLQNVLLPLEIVQPHKSQMRRKRAAYQQSAHDLLQTVGLEGFQHHYPWQLSGGMKQRVSLCRALIHQPEILLLDEPFGALDAFTREDMWSMLQALWLRTQCTALLVTHDLREALFLSDVVYVMSARPSQILLELTVNLPRPRTMEMTFTDEFHHLFNELRRHIHH